MYEDIGFEDFGELGLQGLAVIHTDGASRGNPGPAAGAFVLSDEAGNIIEAKGVFIGESTNNVAEYMGLAHGLEAARNAGVCSVRIFSDSELLVRQIKGEYKVKSENLKDVYKRCVSLLSDFDKWEISHIERAKNSEADSLANRAVDMEREIALENKKVRSSGRHIRLGVLISGGGRTMVNIQKEIDAGNLNAEIALVISSRSTVKGIERAEGLGLKLEIVRKKDFADIEQFSGRLYELLKEAEIDLVVQAGWLCLWQIPEEYENRVMNIHPALLPSFGGQGMWGHHVHEAVLKAGCKISGCTVHFCTNEYDEGAIIVQRSCEVRADDDADSLAARVFEQECIAYPEAIRLFSEGKLCFENGVVKVKQH